MKCAVRQCSSEKKAYGVCTYHSKLYIKSTTDNFNEWLDECNKRLDRKLARFAEIINR